MKKLILISLLLILSACTTTAPIETQTKVEDNGELDKVAKEFLDESKEEVIKESPTRIITHNSGEDEVKEEEPRREEPKEEVEEEKNSIDISVRSIDVDHSNSFDLEDDKVKFEIRLETTGLEKGDFFIVEIIAIRKGEEENSCEYVYVVDVDTGDDGCDMENFQRLGEYDVVVIADSKSKFDETNENNNQKRDDFELEE